MCPRIEARIRRRQKYGKKVWGILLGFLLILGAGQTLADEIVLENGNVLTGTIEKVEGGKLILKTDYSQPIKIQTSKIKKANTDKPVGLYLSSEESVKGKVQTGQDGKLLVEHAPWDTERRLPMDPGFAVHTLSLSSSSFPPPG
jgi:hypothetical protein